ncbi:MAG: undecaprenyl-diphosphate phosphatase [Kiloniellales bacterium]
MPLLYVVVLAVVQGITEFLPISSSGHLEISWQVMSRTEVALPDPDHRLILFVAVHIGTLFAVLVYFWRDVAALALGFWRLISLRGGPQTKLLLNIVVATLPVIAAGYLLQGIALTTLYSIEVIAWATIGFGVVLLVTDRLGMTVRRVEHLTMAGALFIGLAQVLALIPGTSRSGITMSAARILGYERVEAARISLLLAIPAILGAGVLEGVDLYQLGNLQLSSDVALATGLAFVSALVAIALMMLWLRRASFLPFVIYRLVLGGVLLWMLHQGYFDGWTPG